MFIAYWPPNSCVLPTPGTRATWSSTLEAIRSDSSSRLMCGSLDFSAMTSRKPLLDFDTVTPCCTTSSGRRGVACETLFCTCICAVSGLVPGLKVRLSDALPSEPDEALK
jgi:hypothetical protein